MKRFGLVALASLAACSGSSGTTGSGATTTATGTATGASTTGAVGTSAAAGTTGTTGVTASGTTSATATSSGTTGVGASSSGTTAGAGSSTSGSTTGSLPTCAPGAVWVGDVCIQQVCAASSAPYSQCLLGDGGFGQCVAGQCYDLESDPLNCGSVGAICTLGTTCTDYACLFSDGGPLCGVAAPCPTGQTCTYSGCIPNDCSAPGTVACAFDAGFEGECCNGVCNAVDDDQNCDGCGFACPSGSACVNYACSPVCTVDNAACTFQGAPGFCCAGVCQLPGSDPQNCGACGEACPSGDNCQLQGSATGANVAVCYPSGGATPTCAPGDVMVGSNCAYEACYCVPSIGCTSGQNTSCALTEAGQALVGSCCGDDCIDPQNDPRNCGGCNLICPNATTCANGVCGVQPTCAELVNGSACTLALTANNGVGVCCSGTCIDPTADDTNCGSCGNVCPSGYSCAGDAGQPQGGCHVGCATTADCPSGTGCNAGQCFELTCAGLSDNTPCGGVDGGGLCCNGACVPADVSNCGSCGVQCPLSGGYTCQGYCYQGSVTDECGGSGCPSGTACAGGGCEPMDCTGRSEGDHCAAGPYLPGACCGGVCSATTEDPANCGACGIACSGACVNGVCLSDQPQVCLQTCGPNTLCVDGSCVGSECAFYGQGGCLARDGAAGSCCLAGACADLSTDPQNCGACGIVCSSGACNNGKCPGAICTAANQNAFCITGSPNNLCCGISCTDIQTDPNNCGYCGGYCSSGVCTAGVCQ